MRRDRRVGDVRGTLRHVLVALTAVAIAGCSAAAPSPAQSHDPGTFVANGDEAKITLARAARSGSGSQQAASRMNDFGFRLYAKLGNGNLVYSPASIALALGMARAGAVGQTATEMDQAMADFAAPSNLASVNSLDQALAAISGEYPNPVGDKETVALRIANAAFAQRGLGLNRDYLNTLASTYGSGVRLCNYAQDPESARRDINGWVAKQTEDRIKELLARGTISEATRLTLVNAIYLKAPWLHPFIKEGTQPAPFHLADGTTVQVPTMTGTIHEAAYGAGPGYRAVELPYVGDSLAMTVIVPDELASFEKSLDGKAFASIVSSLSPTSVELSLPKFKLETQASLAELLSKLGIKLAFDPDNADFSGITTEEQLFISAVIHQANIDVDEYGTEAAAATAVVMDASAMPADQPILRVDRPFIFALRDRQSGAIVFLGRVLDPSKG